VITHLKLQKLLYYAQAWHLATKNKPLFAEDFQAWIHGPTLISQYDRFKKHQWLPVLEDIEFPHLKNKSLVSHLEEVVDVFGAETAVKLELMTHNERPWQDARKGVSEDAPNAAVISKESMRTFYKSV